MELNNGKLARKSDAVRMPLTPALAGAAGYGQLMSISREELTAAAKSLEGRGGVPGGDPATPQPRTWEWI
jgi:hypothetical protein